MAAHSVNPYEEVAREKKARALGNALLGAQISASDARRMDAGQWKLAARFARTTEPSQLTVEAVINYLDSIEAARAREAGLDPFRGF